MSDKEINVGSVGGNFTSNEAGRDNNVAGDDVVLGNKTINNYGATLTPPVPPLLPYLLDRYDQQDMLVDAIEQHKGGKSPLICVFYGEEGNCCSDKFVERIQHKVLPKLDFCLKQTPDIAQIRTGEPKDEAQLHRYMKMSLEERFLGYQQARFSFENLSTQFATGCAAPILTYSCLSTRDYLRFGSADLIQTFIKFWQQWHTHPLQNHLILVCLFVYLEPCQLSVFDRLRGKKDPNIALKETLKNLNFEQCGVQGIILPELEGISRKDVQEWAMDKDVIDHFGYPIYEEIKGKVNDVYERREQEKQTLSTIGSELSKLLQPLVPRKPT